MLITSAITENGDAITYRGDSYLNADGRALEWEDADFPDITGASIAVIIDGVGSFVGAVVAADKCRLELTTADTETIPAGRYQFQVVATLGNMVATIVEASWVSRNRTEV